VPNSSLNVPAIAVEGQVDLGQEVIFENPPSGLPLSVYGHEVSGGFVLPEETFPEGPNTVRLSAEDAAGNYSEILVDFLIDTQPPAITDVTVWVDTTDQTGPYAVQATVTDGDELLYAKLAYTLNGGSLVEVSMQPQGGNLWRGEIPGQPVGTSITYYAKARDLAGNIGTQPSAANPLKFRVVERQAPVITGVTALGDTDDTVNPYVVTANVSDNTVVTRFRPSH
jgi:hypothetical protein